MQPSTYRAGTGLRTIEHRHQLGPSWEAVQIDFFDCGPVPCSIALVEWAVGGGVDAHKHR
jgi:hypothetical protein